MITQPRWRFEESLALFRAVGDNELDRHGHLLPGEHRRGAAGLCSRPQLAGGKPGAGPPADDTWGTALALFSLGLTAGYQGDAAPAYALLEESLAIFRAVGARGLEGEALVGLGDIARQQGDLGQARTHFAASLSILRGTANPRQLIMPLQGLGYVALAEGDAPQATALFREGLLLLGVPEQTPLLIAGGLAGLAGAAALHGHAIRAARLFGAASALLTALGAQLSPPDQAAWAQYTAVAQAGLDAGAWSRPGPLGPRSHRPRRSRRRWPTCAECVSAHENRRVTRHVIRWANRLFGKEYLRLPMLFEPWIYGLLGSVPGDYLTALPLGRPVDWTFRGYTYVWMLPIYGLIGPLYEPIHSRLRAVAWPLRALGHALGFIGVEAGTGVLLTRLLGRCPWDYTGRSRWQIGGVTRLDYAPLWAALGLALEPLHDGLERLTPAIAEAFRPRKEIRLPLRSQRTPVPRLRRNPPP